jgi:hypothetical protein
MAEKLKVIIQAQDKFSGTFGKFKSVLPSLKTLAIGAGAGIAGATTALAAMVKTTATAYDEIAKLSTQLGVSTEFLSGMRHAADLSGVQVRNMEKAVQMLQVRIGEAGRGIGQARDAFDALGVSLYDSSGELRNAEEIMPDLAQAFAEMTNETERAEAASKIFGQRGMAMIQMFKDGRSGLQAMTDEAERFGLVVSSEAAANAEAFNDSLTRVTGAFRGIKNMIAEQVFPEITKVADRFANWVADNRELIVLKTADWLRNVALMLKSIGEGLLWIDQNITDPVFEFLFGRTRDMSQYELLNQQIKIARDNIHDYYVALAEGEIVDEKFLKLQEDKIKFLQAEIAALKQRKTIKVEGTGEGPEIPEIPELQTQKLIIEPEVSQEKLDILDATLDAYFSDLDSANIGEILADQLFPKAEVLADELEGLRALWAEYYSTEEGRVNQWYAKQLQLHGDNAEAVALIDEIYQAKKDEIAAGEAEKEAAKLEELELLHQEYTMTRAEQLEMWYQQQREQYAGHQEALAKIDEIYAEKKKKIQLSTTDVASKVLGETLALTQAFGKKGFAFQKALSIANATMYAYESFDKTMAAYPYPLNAVLAAISLATAMAKVAAIAAQQPPAAHGGLESVPREQTYLLAQGERVLSPAQNEDLTSFLDKANEGGVGNTIIIERLSVLENATNIDALMAMSHNEMRDLIEEKMIEPLRELKLAGYSI